MNKKQLIAIAVVVGVIATGLIGFTVIKNIMIKGDPFNHLFYSMTQNQYDSVEARIEGNLEVDESMLQNSLAYFTADPEAMAKFVSSVLNEINVSGDIKMAYDLKAKSIFLSENIHLNYADKKMLSFGVGYDGEQMLLSSETFTDKMFHLTKQDTFDLIETYGGVDLSEIDFDKYIDVFDMENDPEYKAVLKNYKSYEEILREKLVGLQKGEPMQVTLADGKSVKCDTITLEMTIDEMTTLYIALLNEARFDDSVKALAKTKANELLTIMLESKDYEKLGMQEADLTTAIEELNNGFDDAWDKGIDEMIRTYQEMQYELQQASVEPFKYKFVVAIDSKYNFRMVEYSTNLMGVSMNQTIYYDRFDLASDLSLEVDPSKTISIKQMADDAAYAEETATALLEESVNRFMDGEALTYFMSDLEEKASALPEAEANAIVDMVKYFTENKEMIKDTLLDNLGL